MTGFLDELVAHIAIDAADQAQLVALHRTLAPQLSAIADAFCVAALDQPRTAAMLSSPRRVAALRAALIDWMTTGLLGPYDDAFYARRAQLAHDQAALGLGAHDLVLALSVVRRAYRDRIAAAYAPAELPAVERAVDKLLDLELAVLLRTYQLDSEAAVVASERQQHGIAA